MVGSVLSEHRDMGRLTPLGYRRSRLLGRYTAPLSADVPPGGFPALGNAVEPGRSEH